MRFEFDKYKGNNREERRLWYFTDINIIQNKMNKCKSRNFYKIFQIGFNKCGTTSINDFLNKNGINSVHYKYEEEEIAMLMINNYNHKRKLLTGLEQFSAFTDMESVNNNVFIYLTHYKELDKQYPNSKFLLNIRNINDWIVSRLNHSGYLLQFQENLSLSSDEVVEYWKKTWYEHISEVQEYFSGRPNDLLVFDIEKENQKFISFMEELCDIEVKEFGKANCSYDIYLQESYISLKKFYCGEVDELKLLDMAKMAWDNVGGVLPTLMFVNKKFNSVGYIKENPDVTNTIYRENPFVHWILYGAKEGRVFYK